MSTTAKNDTGDAPTKRFCGKPGRSGPAKGNGNAIRHGLKAGQLPKDCRYIELRLNAFRRQLEAIVMEAKRRVSMTDAAVIQTCLRWERHAALAQRWLVKAGDTLKPIERLKFSEAIAKASAERDKALAMLKIDRDAKDGAIEALYARLPGPTDNGKDNADESA